MSAPRQTHTTFPCAVKRGATRDAPGVDQGGNVDKLTLLGPWRPEIDPNSRCQPSIPGALAQEVDTFSADTKLTVAFLGSFAVGRQDDASEVCRCEPRETSRAGRASNPFRIKFNPEEILHTEKYLEYAAQFLEEANRSNFSRVRVDQAPRLVRAHGSQIMELPHLLLHSGAGPLTDRG